MATKNFEAKKKLKELEENSYRYHRMMTRLGRTRNHDDTDFQDACWEIGKLQGFKQGIEAAVQMLK